MPNSTLPGNTYLGDGQRTTAEIQAGLNQVAAWLNAAQAELNALTGTTFGEAAVRGVGTALDDLVQTSQLNTRLGTTGNLEGLDGFNPREPALVWTGSSGLIDYTEITGGDDNGIFIFEFSPEEVTGTYRGSVYRDAGSLQRQILYFNANVVAGQPYQIIVYVDFQSTRLRLLTQVLDDSNTLYGTSATNIWKV